MYQGQISYSRAPASVPASGTYQGIQGTHVSQPTVVSAPRQTYSSSLYGQPSGTIVQQPSSNVVYGQPSGTIVQQQSSNVVYGQPTSTFVQQPQQQTIYSSSTLQNSTSVIRAAPASAAPSGTVIRAAPVTAAAPPPAIRAAPASTSTHSAHSAHSHSAHSAPHSAHSAHAPHSAHTGHSHTHARSHSNHSHSAPHSHSAHESESDREVSDRAAAWTAKMQWEFNELPHPEGFSFYYKCIIVAASADGDLDPKEREWIVGYAAAMGAPAKVLQEIESVDFHTLKVQDFGKDFDKFCQRVDTRTQASKKGIIFDCIRGASADGTFQADERRAVLDLAKRFKLTEADFQQIEEIAKEEKELRQKKAALVNNN